jgi:hypothetical protein
MTPLLRITRIVALMTAEAGTVPADVGAVAMISDSAGSAPVMLQLWIFGLGAACAGSSSQLYHW